MKNTQVQDTTGTSEIDITPMLDVVFIMLIFFIVTASFVKEEGLGIYTPSSHTNEAPNTKPILLQINSNNEISIQGRTVDARAIESVITRMKAENPDSLVVVKVDRTANTKALVRALDGIRSANVLYPSVKLYTS